MSLSRASTRGSYSRIEGVTLGPFRHPAGGGIPLRWPSSSSRCSPWRGGSSSPSGMRVCTSSYVFDLSLSRVLEVLWSWCIASIPIIVGSYDVFSPLYSLVMDWVFPLKLSYRIESLRIWEHLMYVLPCLSVVTMGYSRAPLDVCFGDQLAGSVTLGIYA